MFSRITLLLSLLMSRLASSAPTDATDVSALLDLKNALIGLRNTASISTWTGDPCGLNATSTNCCFFSSTGRVPACSWANICCASNRVTHVDVGCQFANCSSSSSPVQVPASVASMSALLYLNLSANGFSGPLPSPLASTSFIGLDLSLNSFVGPLPSTWGSLARLNFLYLNDNALTGSIPASWANLLSLSQLDLAGNCGLCGGVPVPRGVLVWAQGTALGYYCGSVNACQASKSALLTTLAIGGGILAGLFVAGMIGRLIALRFYRSSSQDEGLTEGQAMGYMDYATRRLQAIIAQRSANSPPPIVIPLFEVLLDERGCSMWASDNMEVPTLIPVDEMGNSKVKYAILVQAPGMYLCLAHPEHETSPETSKKKKKGKETKEQPEVELTVRGDATSSEVGITPPPRRWSPNTRSPAPEIEVDLEAQDSPVPGQVTPPPTTSTGRKSSPSNKVHPGRDPSF